MVKLEQSVVNFVQIKHYFVAACRVHDTVHVCRLLLNFTENSIETSQTNRSVSTSKYLSLTAFLFVCLLFFCSSSKIFISKATNSTFSFTILGDFYTIFK